MCSYVKCFLDIILYSYCFLKVLLSFCCCSKYTHLWDNKCILMGIFYISRIFFSSGSFYVTSCSQVNPWLWSKVQDSQDFSSSSLVFRYCEIFDLCLGSLSWVLLLLGRGGLHPVQPWLESNHHRGIILSPVCLLT